VVLEDDSDNGSENESTHVVEESDNDSDNDDEEDLSKLEDDDSDSDLMESELDRLEREVEEKSRIEREERERARLEAHQRELARVAAEEERVRREAAQTELARLAEEEERARGEVEEKERARIAAEEEAARLEGEDRERARIAAEEEERARQEAEEQERIRIAAEEEQQRLEAKERERARIAADEEERSRLEAEEQERARIAAEEERARLEAEVRERARIAEEDRIRLEAEERERLRIGAEEEKARLEAEELDRARIAAAEEEEKARLEAEDRERARIAAEEEERLRLEAEERKRARIAAEEERVRLEAEIERARVAAEEERLRLEAEELERARIAAEEEQARLEAEERARIAAEEERLRLEAEERERARIAAEDEKARLEAEERARIAAEEEKLRLDAEERERARIAAEEERARQEVEERERARVAEEHRLRLEAEEREQARIAAEEERARIEGAQLDLARELIGGIRAAVQASIIESHRRSNELVAQTPREKTALPDRSVVDQTETRLLADLEESARARLLNITEMVVTEHESSRHEAQRSVDAAVMNAKAESSRASHERLRNSLALDSSGESSDNVSREAEEQRLFEDYWRQVAEDSIRATKHYQEEAKKTVGDKLARLAGAEAASIAANGAELSSGWAQRKTELDAVIAANEQARDRHRTHVSSAVVRVFNDAVIDHKALVARAEQEAASRRVYPAQEEETRMWSEIGREIALMAASGSMTAQENFIMQLSKDFREDEQAERNQVVADGEAEKDFLSRKQAVLDAAQANHKTSLESLEVEQSRLWEEFTVTVSKALESAQEEVRSEIHAIRHKLLVDRAGDSTGRVQILVEALMDEKLLEAKASVFGQSTEKLSASSGFDAVVEKTEERLVALQESSTVKHHSLGDTVRTMHSDARQQLQAQVADVIGKAKGEEIVASRDRFEAAVSGSGADDQEAVDLQLFERRWQSVRDEVVELVKSNHEQTSGLVAERLTQHAKDEADDVHRLDAECAEAEARWRAESEAVSEALRQEISAREAQAWAKQESIWSDALADALESVSRAEEDAKASRAGPLSDAEVQLWAQARENTMAAAARSRAMAEEHCRSQLQTLASEDLAADNARRAEENSRLEAMRTRRQTQIARGQANHRETVESEDSQQTLHWDELRSVSSEAVDAAQNELRAEIEKMRHDELVSRFTDSAEQLQTTLLASLKEKSEVARATMAAMSPEQIPARDTEADEESERLLLIPLEETAAARRESTSQLITAENEQHRNDGHLKSSELVSLARKESLEASKKRLRAAISDNNKDAAQALSEDSRMFNEKWQSVSSEAARKLKSCREEAEIAIRLKLLQLTKEDMDSTAVNDIQWTAFEARRKTELAAVVAAVEQAGRARASQLRDSQEQLWSSLSQNALALVTHTEQQAATNRLGPISKQHTQIWAAARDTAVKLVEQFRAESEAECASLVEKLAAEDASALEARKMEEHANMERLRSRRTLLLASDQASRQTTAESAQSEEDELWAQLTATVASAADSAREEVRSELEAFKQKLFADHAGDLVGQVQLRVRGLIDEKQREFWAALPFPETVAMPLTGNEAENRLVSSLEASSSDRQRIACESVRAEHEQALREAQAKISGAHAKAKAEPIRESEKLLRNGQNNLQQSSFEEKHWEKILQQTVATVEALRDEARATIAKNLYELSAEEAAAIESSNTEFAAYEEQRKAEGVAASEALRQAASARESQAWAGLDRIWSAALASALEPVAKAEAEARSKMGSGSSEAETLLWSQARDNAQTLVSQSRETAEAECKAHLQLLAAKESEATEAKQVELVAYLQAIDSARQKQIAAGQDSQRAALEAVEREQNQLWADLLAKSSKEVKLAREEARIEIDRLRQSLSVERASSAASQVQLRVQELLNKKLQEAKATLTSPSEDLSPRDVTTEGEALVTKMKESSVERQQKRSSMIKSEHETSQRDVQQKTSEACLKAKEESLRVHSEKLRQSSAGDDADKLALDTGAFEEHWQGVTREASSLLAESREAALKAVAETLTQLLAVETTATAAAGAEFAAYESRWTAELEALDETSRQADKLHEANTLQSQGAFWSVVSANVLDMVSEAESQAAAAGAGKPNEAEAELWARTREEVTALVARTQALAEEELKGQLQAQAGKREAARSVRRSEETSRIEAIRNRFQETSASATSSQQAEQAALVAEQDQLWTETETSSSQMLASAKEAVRAELEELIRKLRAEHAEAKSKRAAQESSAAQDADRKRLEAIRQRKEQEEADAERQRIESIEKERIEREAADQEEARLRKEEAERLACIVIPNPGLVIKTKRVRDNHKLFINLCHHEMIPSDVSGKARKAGSIKDVKRILLVVGECRESNDKSGEVCTLVDVVVNSTRYADCMDDNNASSQVSCI
jgi:hypothetical protein